MRVWRAKVAGVVGDERGSDAEAYCRLGNASSAVVVADLGNLRDFDCPASLVRCLGLNLKEVSSGQQKGRLRITKRGSSRAHHYLLYAALRCIYRVPIVGTWYAKKRARSADAGLVGDAGLAGVVAVLRKLAAALWHMARGAEFKPEKLYNTKLLNLGPSAKEIRTPTDGVDEQLTVVPNDNRQRNESK